MTSVEVLTLSEQQIYSIGISCWTTLQTKLSADVLYCWNY